MIGYEYKMLRKPSGSKLATEIGRHKGKGWSMQGTPFFGVDEDGKGYFFQLMQTTILTKDGAK